MDDLRRSNRNPEDSHLERTEVKVLLSKIRSNHKDTIVLKLKDHLRADVSAGVVESVLDALRHNKVCQALYLQNLLKGFGDKQLKALVSLLKTKLIWCLNLGENYHVSGLGWAEFCNDLPATNVTHLYVSEHVIKIDLKNLMRLHIRNNRKKHDKHSTFKNITIIERCTNMWWNPINAIRHQLDVQAASKIKLKCDKNESKKIVNTRELTPRDAAYWAEGFGKGGEKPWKFNCLCGETCSSYENYRYHPVGSQFECTTCGSWSHVVCVLGQFSEEDLEELPEVNCHSCQTKLRRMRHAELRTLNLVWRDGKVTSTLSPAFNTDGVKDEVFNSEDGDADCETDSKSEVPSASDEQHESAMDSEDSTGSTDDYPKSDDENPKDLLDSPKYHDGVTDRDDSSKESEGNSIQSSLSASDGESCVLLAAVKSISIPPVPHLQPREDEGYKLSGQTSAVTLIPRPPPKSFSGILEESLLPSVPMNPHLLTRAASEQTLCSGYESKPTASDLWRSASSDAGEILRFTLADAVPSIVKAAEFNSFSDTSSHKRFSSMNDLGFSETVFDNETFYSEDMRAKKKRMSKGAAFQLNSFVYVPELKRSGVITEEKNGGWKFVKFDHSAVALKGEKNGKSRGKWCRAGEMLLDQGGSEYTGSYEIPSKSPDVWPSAMIPHAETPFSVPDDFLEAFDNQEYWE